MVFSFSGSILCACCNNCGALVRAGAQNGKRKGKGKARSQERKKEGDGMEAMETECWCMCCADSAAHPPGVSACAYLVSTAGSGRDASSRPHLLHVFVCQRKKFVPYTWCCDPPELA